MKRYIRILPPLLSLALMVGCASNSQSTNLGPSTGSSDAANRETIRQQQMAIDSANAAAMQNRAGGTMGR
jgi:uncharacterized lipoprotein YajG